MGTRPINKAAQWKPGQSGNPSGKSAQIEAARGLVRDFMVNGGGLTAWMSLVLDKDPKVRMYVFRDLVWFAFGWAPQEIAVERTTATLTMGVHAVIDSRKQQELETLRGRVREALLDLSTRIPRGEETDGDSNETTDRGDDPGSSAA